MRDLNNDLYKEPFNEELKALASEFGSLLKQIVDTIDRFGLKARYLRKHGQDVTDSSETCQNAATRARLLRNTENASREIANCSLPFSNMTA
jgi:hypothetical protein